MASKRKPAKPKAKAKPAATRRRRKPGTSGTPKKRAGEKPKVKAKPKRKPASKRKPPQTLVPRDQAPAEVLPELLQRPYENGSQKWMRPFLEAFEMFHTVADACKAANVGRSTVYRHRVADEDFALAWLDVETLTTELMEKEAFRRATKGLVRNVYDARGNLLREELIFSDTLLIFLLKGRKPEVYRDRVDHRHSGEVKAPEARADLSKLTLEEAKLLRTLVAKAKPDEEAVPA